VSHACAEAGKPVCSKEEAAAHWQKLQVWEHAKWVIRVSVMAEVTLIDHLLWSHLVVSNGVSNAAFKHLEPSHRIRQLLKPFTFRANTINFSAYLTLIAEDGMADHWFGFTRAELARFMERGSRSFKYVKSTYMLK
jgi:hypothetical protein